MVLFIFLVAGIVYLYQRTLICYDIVDCYSYDLNVYQARPTIYTVKYYYKYKHRYYFDQKRYTSPQNALVGYVSQARVFRFNPSKNHFIEKGVIDTLKYDSKSQDKFIDNLNVNIKSIQGYYPNKFNKTILENNKLLIYPNNIGVIEQDKVAETLNKIVFCEGSLIERYILDMDENGYKIYFIFYYLNDFSLDSQLMNTYQSLLNEILNKPIMLIAIDRNKVNEQKIYVNN